MGVDAEAVVANASVANVFVDRLAPWTLRKENGFIIMGGVLAVLCLFMMFFLLLLRMIVSRPSIEQQSYTVVVDADGLICVSECNSPSQVIGISP